ncbi:MAG: methionine adenosyltransferase [Bdellovibrionales bacterium]|nr:methionine adenosyltransferase [Bdellovibrionales bacterium]
METFFTSESVSEGHPDKLADQISDAILDAFLKKDSYSHVACEVLVTHKKVFICGEINSQVEIDVIKIARNTIKKVGYDSIIKGLDYDKCSIENLLHSQSPDIKKKVGSGENQGAGDQGIMFGYATDETEVAMPLSIHLAHKLMENLSYLRKKRQDIWPDSKSQVTVRYKDNQPKDVSTILISTQHDPQFNLKNLQEFIHEELIKTTIPQKYLTNKTKIIVNSGGQFVIGGPKGDCGLTGRKIIVDTYGGHGSHGGGAFSGKDPSKVDRSAAYSARHIAKNFVKAGLVKKCLVQISYAIGTPEPISIYFHDFNSSQIKNQNQLDLISKHWNLKPSFIIKDLDLLNRNYEKTAVYGHFGRKGDNFTWEKLDKVNQLKEYVH